MMRLALTAIALAIAGIAQAQACQLPVLGPTAKTIADEKNGIALTWQFAPQPKIGQFFAVEFAVCDRAGAVTVDTLRVDAQMPAHRHGMNFQPKIAATSANVFRADGLMFHMPGKWQVVFERRASAGTARLTSDVEIE